MDEDTYNPFSLQQAPISLSSTFGSWLGNGNGMASPSMEDQLMQAQMAYYNQLPGLEQQKIDIAKLAAKPQNGWVTGAQTFGNLAQGLSGLASIYLGLQGLKQQKKTFEFNKGIANTNINNSITDYNRRLTDTLNNRALNNGQGQGWVSSQLAKYSAKRS